MLIFRRCRVFLHEIACPGSSDRLELVPLLRGIVTSRSFKRRIPSLLVCRYLRDGANCGWRCHADVKCVGGGGGGGGLFLHILFCMFFRSRANATNLPTRLLAIRREMRPPLAVGMQARKQLSPNGGSFSRTFSYLKKILIMQTHHHACKSSLTHMRAKITRINARKQRTRIVLKKGITISTSRPTSTRYCEHSNLSITGINRVIFRVVLLEEWWSPRQVGETGAG